MFKKVVSKALLSVVMDKKARSKLEAAKARAEQAPQAETKTPAEDPRVAARQALEQAEKDLAAKPKLSADRKALILQALAVRKQKTTLLDELGPDQKLKLQAMALEAFGLDPTKSGR